MDVLKHYLFYVFAVIFFILLNEICWHGCSQALPFFHMYLQSTISDFAKLNLLACVFSKITFLVQDVDTISGRVSGLKLRGCTNLKINFLISQPKHKLWVLKNPSR